VKTSTQFYLTEAQTSAREEWSKLHATAEKDDGVSSRSDECWRQMEDADWVSVTQRNQTLRRIAAAHSRSQSANALDAVAGFRADGVDSSAEVFPDAPKG
jgi:DNA replication protein DnaC